MRFKLVESLEFNEELNKNTSKEEIEAVKETVKTEVVEE